MSRSRLGLGHEGLVSIPDTNCNKTSSINLYQLYSAIVNIRHMHTDCDVFPACLALCDMENSAYFADNSGNCRQIIFFYEWWDVSPATNHSILVLIWITMQIGEFLTEFLPLGDMANCENFFRPTP